jgi:threonine/homoserine/homoserine lactone efflux protein
VGAIAVLILETGMRRGFRGAFAAGTGAAAADLAYASLAAVAGPPIAAALSSYSLPLRLGSAALLLAIGVRGLWAGWSRRPDSPSDSSPAGGGDPEPDAGRSARHASRGDPVPDPGRSARLTSRSDPSAAPAPSTALRTFAQFLALTLLNPLTVAYFAALMLGRGAANPLGAAGRLAFVAGAWLASWSWQTLLAASGALARRLLSRRAQRFTALAGNAVVVGFGLRILVGLFGGEGN